MPLILVGRAYNEGLYGEWYYGGKVIADTGAGRYGGSPERIAAPSRIAPFGTSGRRVERFDASRKVERFT